MGREWIVLRTAGRATIRVTQELRRQDVEAWTPVRKIRMRRARWNASREIAVPLLASFVFAKARHRDLLAERALRPGAEFSLFRDCCGEIAYVGDAALGPLRREEAAPATSAELKRLFRPGESVRAASGIFGGMTGTVERNDGAATWVRFGPRMRVQISTSILEQDRCISRRQAHSGTAAQAASAIA